MTNKYFKRAFLWLLACSFIYFCFFISNDIILDDNEFIFGEKGLINSPNFWAFWQGDSGFTRSWPISFSVLWILTKIFSYNYFLYKIVNILLHILNSYLLHRFTEKYFSPRLNFFIGALFLLHPMQIESIFWIFQIKTLLSITFLLFAGFHIRSYLESQSLKSYRNGLFFFYLSLASKITAIFFPIFLIYFFYKKKKRFLLLSLPFFLLSGYVGIQTIKGVRFSEVEQYYSNKVYLKDYNQSLATPAALQVSNNLVKNSINYLESGSNDREAFGEYYTQLRVIAVTTSFYVKKYLLIGENSFFYKHNYFNTNTERYSYFIAVVFFSLFFLICYQNKTSLTLFYLYIIFHLPVSGIVYIPYMKYSLVADHWAYLSIIPIIIISVVLINSLIKSQRIANAFLLFFFAFLSIKNFNYMKIFSDKRKLLEHSMSINKTDTTLALEMIKDLYQKKDSTLKRALESMLKNTNYSNSIFFLDQVYVIANELSFHEIVETVLFKRATIFMKDSEMGAYLRTVEELERLNSENSNFKLLKLINHSENIKKLTKQEIAQIFN